MEATQIIAITAEKTVEQDAEQPTAALRELTALELSIVGGGSAAVVFL